MVRVYSFADNRAKIAEMLARNPLPEESARAFGQIRFTKLEKPMILPSGLPAFSWSKAGYWISPKWGKNISQFRRQLAN